VAADEPIRDANGFMQKVNVGETGLLLGEISDTNPLFVLLPEASEYQPLTRDIYLKIMVGEYRF
jgi:hypothetical protein